MAPLQAKNSVTTILHVVLWGTILSVASYVLYCYLTGRFVSFEQAIVTLAILVVLLLGTLTRKTLLYLLILTLIVGHLAIAIVWGNLVPFVRFFPLLISFLLVTDNKPNPARAYLVGALLLNIIELTGLLPLARIDAVEIGPTNLIIVTILQGLVYFLWDYLLRLYRLVADLDFLGFTHHDNRISAGFLRSTLANGLYMSILLHLFNNLLNDSVWKIRPRKEKLEILKLLGASDRLQGNRTCKLQTVTSLTRLELSAVPPHVDLTLHSAKLLFIFLESIVQNYHKYASNVHCTLNYNGDAEQLTFTLSGKAYKRINSEKIWTRNLGSIRQFLDLTGTGTLELLDSRTDFITVLRFSC